MLAPNPLATVSWPIAGDVASLQAIIAGQAEVIEDQEALLHAYQGNLNLAQGVEPAPAVATGTASGTALTLAGVTGTVLVGAVATSTALVPAGTTVVGQISGTPGGAGVYLTSAPTTVSATSVAFQLGAQAPATATATAAGTQLTVSGVVGTIAVGAVLTSTALVPFNTTILSQSSGVSGGAGVYATSLATTVSATPMSFALAAPAAWPIPTDAPTLDLIVQQQTAIIRTQTALIQHYQDVLNTSQTPAPPAGP